MGNSCGSNKAAGDVAPAATAPGKATAPTKAVAPSAQKAKSSVDLYVAMASPACRAVFMCAKEIQVEPNLKLINPAKGETRTEEYLKMNPCHCVPTMTDGDLTIWESAAIMLYLNGKYAADPGLLYPTDLQRRAEVNLMFGFNQGFSASILEFVAPQLFQGKEPDAQLEEKVKTKLDLFNKILEGKTFVTWWGITLADFSLMAYLSLLDYGYDYKSSYPNIKDWNERMRALPYYEETNKGWYEVLRAKSS